MYERPWFDYPALRAVAGMAGDNEWDDLRALLRRSLCVPFHPGMTSADVVRVCAALGPFDGYGGG
jgi:dTDP-4-amino-4,6-dideoxygalactose transaminase